MSGFPVDDISLRLLAEACRINPDTGQTHLATYLDMAARIKSVTDETTGETYATLSEARDAAVDSVPTFLIEHEPGYEPHSPQSVILALIAEIERLRGPGDETSEQP